ncbi:hypothetical protein SK803_24955 [Lentzea sp. BCCO 10_0856]|uniref:Uncharacterized protein n=1 Tax=Lentzea miocenica TaxID=3095431 RepID=A0ABU4T5M9_9PSEU|nr:hypothetical protein [Lentzea sp. BCCO 10_0856]MDX8033481.1 hypothetical protein [Lentzea sp. BCCO 10_0856]
MRDELVRIANEYRWFDRPSRHEQLARELRKQEAIVANLAAVNGYKTTRSASLDLVVDIEVHIWDLQRKLSSSVFKAAQAVLRTLLETLLRMKIGGQQALPPGRSSSSIH